ncbi:hypothetical protein GCWU000342_02057 [Shuttleworthella satelles DSM 14600]|uniref:Uncharacterized protein n=1 Tax=Shuttleworthella satelles DSM 14600 TaxID=626523 RepID=C4GEB0_9FIRM|nr:hypothetical protein GCWU000342_02057 [Shuttleworthia satelles DSM 14600]
MLPAPCDHPPLISTDLFMVKPSRHCLPQGIRQTDTSGARLLFYQRKQGKKSAGKA